MTPNLPPGYSIVSIRRGKQFLLRLNERAIGILSDRTELCRLAETDFTQRKPKMKKSELKVFEVPFKTEVSGTVMVLAPDAEAATAYLEGKIEDATFGWDNNNLQEEGILHDGSIEFNEAKGGEIELNDPRPSQMEPKDHSMWGAFETEEDGDTIIE